ncbi:MAG TPA: Fe-S cluster assembly ATPase SufC [Candidatus Thermoplasmatota archaeon]
MPPLLEIKNLHAKVADKEILQGINLTIQPGEVHAIMGPNGSGKSTLANVLAGRETFDVTQGTVLYKGKDLLAMATEERAREGLFLAFQYPVEIPGVGNMQFLRASLNAARKHRGEKDIDVKEFVKMLRDKAKLLKLDETLLRRNLNEGFSGGEKKRNEIFQMAVLEPTMCVLDETDSGLDIDALRVVSDGVNGLRNNERGMLVITHYNRLLKYIVPDYVHVLAKGKIVKSGGRQLAESLEEEGYGELVAPDSKA